nr:hypothetical protein [uncultured Ruminococcus sp.]
MERKSQKKLLRGAFLRISFSNILVLIAFCACGIIDNLFVGRMLGKDALAAVGFFSPVTVAVWLSNTIIDELCLIVVLISVVVYNGRIDFSMSALL